MTSALRAHHLTGSPEQRGLAQAAAAAGDAPAIRATLAARHDAARARLETAEARRYLARQWSFAERHCATELAELIGVAKGFAVDPATIFALFHLSALSGTFDPDGCSAWARPVASGGAMLAKNRDLSGPHAAWQDTFVHHDPAARGGAVFCVGTFGAPGVYSSGMNEAGLALADTAISAPCHGIGWPRYLLMTRLLWTCRTVEEACDTMASVSHAGGGSLILADATGAVAAVELLADGARIERQTPAFRTNHFRCEDPSAVAARLAPATWRSTTGRASALAAHLASGLGTRGPMDALSTMADHGDGDREALCRHGGSDDSRTVSCVVYETATGGILFTRGSPCSAPVGAGRLGLLTREDAP